MINKVDLLPFCVLLLLLLCYRSGQTQTLFGMSAGGGLTQLTGFRAALPLEYELKNNLYIFGGPAFLQRRNQEIIRKLNQMRDYFTVEMDYISLPAALKLRLDLSPLRIYGLVGIELNYGVRIQATGVEDQRLFKEKLDFKEIGVTRLDGGVYAGAGFETDLRQQRKIFADFRYYLGVLDIDQSSLGEIYNDGAYLTLGFLMPLKMVDGGR